MRRQQLIIATLISSTAHGLVLATVIWLSGLTPVSAFGEKYAVISVDVVSEPGESTEPAAERPRDMSVINPKDKIRVREKAIPQTAMKKDANIGDPRESTGSLGIPGTPGAAGANLILAQIRAKIEAAKRYPRPARRMKIEGRPTVLFQINSDGSLKYVNLAKSCGETILDNAAVETVRKAAPLPYYEKPIRLKIKYELRK